MYKYVVKGTCTIESATSVSDITTNNSREQLFNVVKDLYGFSKKVLNSIRTADTEKFVQDSSQAIENAIKKQLNEILPSLLQESLSKLPAVQPQPEKVEEEEKSLPTMHTLIVKKKPEVEEGESPPISKNEWTEVVRKDFKGTLKSIPVQKASLSSGTTTLRFASKDHLDEAEKALTNKYKVSPKSQDQKKLEPKLTISDLDPDIVSKEELYEEILEENKFIKDIDGANKMKVVFLDKKDHFAVVQVSTEIRYAIRKMVIGSILVYKVTMLEIVSMLSNAIIVRSLVTPVDPSTASQKTQIQHVASVLVVMHQESVQIRGIEK